MAGLSLDAGALIAAERNDRAVWAFLGEVLTDGVVPLVPAAALAQAWRGAPSARIAQLLKGCEIVPLDEDLAKESGELLARSRTHDAVDASVMAATARFGGKVLTSDPGDLRRLAGHIKGVAIVDIRELRQPKK